MIQPVVDGISEQKIAEIFGWDFHNVANLLTRDGEMKEPEAKSRIEEYKKFMAVNVAFGLEHAICKEVDDVWHAHILCTRDYTEFSNTVFGHFLHHVPIFDEPGQEALRKDYYARTLPELKVLFGEVSPIWTEARVICMGSGCGGVVSY